MTILSRAASSLRARSRALLTQWQSRIPAMVGRADEFELKRSFQIAFLREQGLSPETDIVDVGCGVLRGGIPMIEALNPDRYCGIDVRSECIRVAKREVRKAGLAHKRPLLIHCTDLRVLRIDRRFDIAWAFSVLIHLTDRALDDALAFVAGHLADDGVFFANVNLGSKDDESWLEFPVRWRTLEQYEAIAVRHGLTVESLGMLKDLGHNSPREPAENLQQMLRFRRAVQQVPATT